MTIPMELTVKQMLDGGHLMLDKYLEDNKDDIRPEIYTAFQKEDTSLSEIAQKHGFDFG